MHLCGQTHSACQATADTLLLTGSRALAGPAAPWHVPVSADKSWEQQNGTALCHMLTLLCAAAAAAYAPPSAAPSYAPPKAAAPALGAMGASASFYGVDTGDKCAAHLPLENTSFALTG